MVQETSFRQDSPLLWTDENDNKSIPCNQQQYMEQLDRTVVECNKEVDAEGVSELHFNEDFATQMLDNAGQQHELLQFSEHNIYTGTTYEHCEYL